MSLKEDRIDIVLSCQVLSIILLIALGFLSIPTFNLYYYHQYDCHVNSIKHIDCPYIFLNMTIPNLELTKLSIVEFPTDKDCHEFVGKVLINNEVKCYYYGDKISIPHMSDFLSIFGIIVMGIIILIMIIVIIAIYKDKGI